MKFQQHTIFSSMNRHIAGWVIATALFALSGQAMAAETRIVASIAPLHGIVASLTQGITTPHLLLAPGASPHSFTLRPSDARALNRADLIVWVGPALENFLMRPLRGLTGKTRLMTLSEIKGIKKLPARGTDHKGHNHAAHNYTASRGIDPHLWLSPDNAKAIARAVTARLTELNPADAGRYGENLSRTLARIDKTRRDIEVLLAPVKKMPFMTFHDAFQYFERAFGLNSAGWIAIDAGRRPSAKRLSALRRMLRKSRARCLFSEPQFPSALLRTVTEGTSTRIAPLDPLGADIDTGPTHWHNMMIGMGRSLRDCLLQR
jgi:zinc transport system substrate-binding protein